MFLSNLPPEVLSIIVIHLEAFLIGRLWISGNKELQWKLSIGGGVKHLVFDNWTPFTVCWPEMLHWFGHLESLQLRLSENDGRYPPFNVAFEKMGSSLKTLDLEFPLGIYRFNDALVMNPRLFPHLTALRIVSAAYTKLNLWNVRQKWPNLQRLEICGSKPISGLDLAVLPETLCYLDLSLTPPLIESGVAFPSRLVWLKMHLRFHFELETLFPSSLRHLEIKADAYAQKEFRWEMLPRELLTLRMRETGWSLRTELVSLLPANLTDLSIHFYQEYRLPCFCKYLDAVKPHLLHLQRLDWGLNEIWNFDFVRRLPDSITGSLDAPVDASAVSFLPRGISDLKVVFLSDSPIFRSSQENGSTASQSNNDSEISSSPLMRLGMVNAFPPKLTKLTLPLLTKEIILAFPETLTSLKISGGDSYVIGDLLKDRSNRLMGNEAQDGNQVEESIALIELLRPLHLKEVRFLETSEFRSNNSPLFEVIFAEKAIRSLPPDLKVLHWSSTDLKCDSDDWWCFDDDDDDGSSSPSNFNRGIPSASSFFQLLPRTITSLKISPLINLGPIPCGLCGHKMSCSCCFKWLPSTLTSLSLGFIQPVPANAFQQLPCQNTLISLRIRILPNPLFMESNSSSSSSPLKFLLKTIPRRVQTFEWLDEEGVESQNIESHHHQSTTVKDNDLALLPPHLTNLELPEDRVDLSEICLPLLPPYLRQFTLSGWTPLWFSAK